MICDPQFAKDLDNFLLIEGYSTGFTSPCGYRISNR